MVPKGVTLVVSLALYTDKTSEPSLAIAIKIQELFLSRKSWATALFNTVMLVIQRHSLFEAVAPAPARSPPSSSKSGYCTY